VAAYLSWVHLAVVGWPPILSCCEVTTPSLSVLMVELIFALSIGHSRDRGGRRRIINNQNTLLGISTSRGVGVSTDLENKFSSQFSLGYWKLDMMTQSLGSQMTVY